MTELKKPVKVFFEFWDGIPLRNTKTAMGPFFVENTQREMTPLFEKFRAQKAFLDRKYGNNVVVFQRFEATREAPRAQSYEVTLEDGTILHSRLQLAAAAGEDDICSPERTVGALYERPQLSFLPTNEDLQKAFEAATGLVAEE